MEPIGPYFSKQTVIANQSALNHGMIATGNH